VLGLLVTSRFVAGLVRVPTESMAPSIRARDAVWINRVAYGFSFFWKPLSLFQWSSPKRGDVVVFKAMACMRVAPNTYVIKRIVAKEGDLVQVLGQRLVINGKALKYSTLNNNLVESEAGERGHPVFTVGKHMASYGPFLVPRGHVFVMGDNRNDSDDSRDWGPLDVRYIEGKADFVVRVVNGGRKTFPAFSNL